MPNPFYQIYEGAALLAGAEPYYINSPKDHQYLPDFSTVPESIWKRCQLLYLCSPGNPTGAVVEIETMQWLLEMADRYDFIIASDECYSEIYSDESRPPPGLLMACDQTGRTDYNRCLVLHSLSKRSNVPGLRSGFVAGDAAIIEQYLQYRTYHGSAMPPATQDASIVAWKDEAHVLENRKLYREKFAAVIDILSPVLDVTAPAGSFYLWPELPIDDEEFARDLFEQQNVIVMPGSYLSRNTEHGNPGKRHTRLALVATQSECVDAATRIRRFIETL
jgi:N-succinyldiaminopimelate aminotransferase